jgi:hypothetical protein
MESKAAWDNLKRSLGEAVMPALMVVMGVATDIAKGLKDAWQALPGPLRFIIGGAATVTSVLLVLGGAFKMITGLSKIAGAALSVFGTGAKAASVAAGAASTSAAATGAAATATAGAISALSFIPPLALAALAFNYWDDISNKLNEVFGVTKKFTDLVAVQERGGMAGVLSAAMEAETGKHLTASGAWVDPTTGAVVAAPGETSAIQGRYGRSAPEIPPEMIGPLPPFLSLAARGETPISGRIIAPSVVAEESAQRRSGGTSPPPAPGRAGGTVVIRPRVDVHFDRDGIRTMVQEEVRSNDALGYAPVPEEVD